VQRYGVVDLGWNSAAAQMLFQLITPRCSNHVLIVNMRATRLYPRKRENGFKAAALEQVGVSRGVLLTSFRPSIEVAELDPQNRRLQGIQTAPAATVTEVGIGALMEKSAPTPSRGTALFPIPLLLILNVANRAPESTGTKLTLIWHEAPTVSEAVQVLACLNWLAFGPETLIGDKVSVSEPVLRNVTICAALVVPTV